MGELSLATNHSHEEAEAAAVAAVDAESWGCHKTCSLGPQLGCCLLEATAKIMLGEMWLVHLRLTLAEKVTTFRQHFLGGLPDSGGCAALHRLWSQLMDLGNISPLSFSRCTSDSCICNSFWNIGKQLIKTLYQEMFHYLCCFTFFFSKRKIKIYTNISRKHDTHR